MITDMYLQFGEYHKNAPQCATGVVALPTAFSSTTKILFFSQKLDELIKVAKNSHITTFQIYQGQIFGQKLLKRIVTTC